jgi:hypothetical protein
VKDSNVNCSESNAERTVGENPTAEQVQQNANTVITSNDSIIICTDSSVDRSGMSSTQLQELPSTLLQTIQSENCKQTAVLEAKLTSESNKPSAESAKQIEEKLTAESNKAVS